MNALEVYVLCNSRSRELAFGFLEKFIPDRESFCDEYEYPQFSDESKCVFHDVEKLIDLLETQTNESYSLYWNAVNDSNVETGMLFFTEDNQMIVGLAVNECNIKKYLKEITSYVDGAFGYVSFESPPPENKDKFIQCCRNSDQIKLIDSQLYM